MIKAPFTEVQVKVLNTYQKLDYVHPYTCGGENCERQKRDDQGKLIATTDGWICPCGKYEQKWAHDVIIHKQKIVFVADIADDIDDTIAIEYLAIIGILECVVLDGKSRDTIREAELEKLGVVFKTEIPIGTKIIFCGGSLTKVNEFIKENKLDLLVANGGFAGTNIVKAENILHKFRNKEKIRTYNFNLDIDSALSVLSSQNVNEIILVSKNVCHSELNCIGKLHKDLFLFKYKLDSGKRLHDLLMVKEGVNFISGNNTICNYEQIQPVCEKRLPDNMSIWGSELSNTSNIFISVSLQTK